VRYLVKTPFGAFSFGGWGGGVGFYSLGFWIFDFMFGGGFGGGWDFGGGGV
jgi:hypothetical protein